MLSLRRAIDYIGTTHRPDRGHEFREDELAAGSSGFFAPGPLPAGKGPSAGSKTLTSSAIGLTLAFLPNLSAILT
jgi:hypothetical protein